MFVSLSLPMLRSSRDASKEPEKTKRKKIATSTLVITCFYLFLIFSLVRKNPKKKGRSAKAVTGNEPELGRVASNPGMLPSQKPAWLAPIASSLTWPLNDVERIKISKHKTIMHSIA